MSLFRRLISVVAVFLAAALLVLTQTGCVAVAAAGAAAGGVAYVSGNLEGYVNASVARTLLSSNLALARMKYLKIKEEADGFSATLTARTGEDTKITIHLNQITETTTEISIRFGVFGDQQLSQVLMTEIRRGI